MTFKLFLEHYQLNKECGIPLDLTLQNLASQNMSKMFMRCNDYRFFYHLVHVKLINELVFVKGQKKSHFICGPLRMS